MRQLELAIPNRAGWHARPAKVLVKLAKEFKADIHVRCNQKRANCKSMVSLLTLGATYGSGISLEASGEDEELALSTIAEAIRTGLGEADSLAEPAAMAPSLVSERQPEQTASLLDPAVFRAIGAAPGIAVGPIFQYRPDELNQDRLDSLPGSAPLSLNEALAQAKQQLAAVHRQMSERDLNAEAAIFEAQLEFLDDPELLESVQAQMKDDQSVARAWQHSIDDRARAIAATANPLIAARADDLRDVGRRVLGLLLGIADKDVTLPAVPVVILARQLAPSAVAALDLERVLGLVIVNGGPTSHIAILARAMGLPAIVGADESVLALANANLVILNGNDGTLITDPDSETLDRSLRAQTLWVESRRQAKLLANLPAATIDGQSVDVTANAGSIADAVAARKMGADGIGLLRTEFLFLDRGVAPDEEEQFRIYRAIAQTMQPLPLVIRTLDIGGDKPVAYIRLNPEANPFLGERGIRLCLNHLDLFNEQLRAILRAASYGKLQIMFPMVSDIGELQQARALVEQQRRSLGAPEVKIGIMVEVPSAALLADKLAPQVDFFSIGTNDLTQYTLAMDRGNAIFAAKQDGLQPAVLRLIAQTVAAAHKHGKRVDLCGELGSDPAAIAILIGLGVDELSVSIPAIPTVKAQIRTLTLPDARSLACEALECSTAAEVRELVRDSSARSRMVGAL